MLMIQFVLTIRLHTAPCLLCMSGVSRTWSVVTMASPISSQWEELEEPTPGTTNYTIVITKADKNKQKTSQLIKPDVQGLFFVKKRKKEKQEGRKNNNIKGKGNTKNNNVCDVQNKVFLTMILIPKNVMEKNNKNNPSRIEIRLNDKKLSY